MSSLAQVRSVNFGRLRANVTGSTGVGFTIFDSGGSIFAARTTVGVYQLSSGSGLYAANITFASDFHGSIQWDCPSITGSLGNILSQSFATEQYDVEENDPKVAQTWQLVQDITGSIQLIRDIEAGRWRMTGNQLILYKEDNATEVQRFNLFDDVGNPSMDAVFERRKV